MIYTVVDHTPFEALCNRADTVLRASGQVSGGRMVRHDLVARHSSEAKPFRFLAQATADAFGSSGSSSLGEVMNMARSDGREVVDIALS